MSELRSQVAGGGCTACLAPITESPVRVRDAWLRGGVEAVAQLIGLLALPLTDLYMRRRKWNTSHPNEARSLPSRYLPV